MKKKESFWTVALAWAVLIGLVITMGGCQPGTDGGEGEGEGEGESEIQIPNLTGQLQADAQAAIVAAGLVVGDVTEMCSDTMSAGRVISANPAGGITVSLGSAVNLWVSTGWSCPIEINTIEELQLIGNDSAYPLDGNYVLAQDIDASATADWNAGAGFKPIGQFNGVFNGQGYIITNLTINQPIKVADHNLKTLNYEEITGLFKYVLFAGKIMNIGLEGGVITGPECIGSLVGWNYGQLTDCYATGTVTGIGFSVGGLVGYNDGQLTDCYSIGAVTGEEIVGGLVGENYGQLTNCYATGVVTVPAGSEIVGGLVGWNFGQLTNCYATGAVTGHNFVGGLVGSNVVNNEEYMGTVMNCYATGAVTGIGFCVGGLVGNNGSTVINNEEYTGTVMNCYATGAVTGYDAVGGLVGENEGAVTNCYATGAVVGESYYVGGLVGGYNYDNNGTVMTSFWNMQTSGQTTSDGGTGLTTADMTQQATFADAGWDFDSVWTIEEGCTYPYLQQLVSPFTGCVY